MGLHWDRFSNELTLLEKILIVIFVSLISLGVTLLLYNLRGTIIGSNNHFKGNNLAIGVIGHPQYINPALSLNNSCDNDIESLVYNGLYQVDGKGGLKPVLAQKTEISPDGKDYLVFLKNNIYWHDGVKFTADDVIFTVHFIQDKNINSPLRLNWSGVTVEKLGNDIIKFHLTTPYEPFLNNLTLKILPAHIWKDIPLKYLSLSEYNLRPIGTGPYLFDHLEKTSQGRIISYWLEANPNYFQNPPKVSRLVIRFYDNYKQLKDAFFRGEINSFLPVSALDASSFSHKRGYQLRALELPRYSAVFFNLNKNIFSREKRDALDLAVSRSQLVQDVFNNEAFPLNGPLSPDFLDGKQQKESYSLTKAQKILADNNISHFSFSLTVPNLPQLVQVASFLQKSWKKIGVDINVRIVSVAQTEKDIIPNRNYDAILFGEITSQDPDLFSFWHSSQVISPGLNLSAYRNTEVDRLLEEARQISNQQKRIDDLTKIQQLLIKDKPAIFLYNPLFLYIIPSNIKGVTIKRANKSADLFSDISNWYIPRHHSFF